MREYYEMEKKEIDIQMEKRLKAEMNKIDERRELKFDDKLAKKEAIEEALDSDRKSKRKKIDAKIKTLMQ